MLIFSANVLAADALLMAGQLVRVVIGPERAVHAIVAGMLAVIAALVWFGRRWFVRYGIPLIGVLFLALVVHILFFQTHGPGLGGPVGLGREAGAVRSVTDVYLYVAAVNLSLAMVNSAPFGPLDGGRIVLASIRRRSAWAAGVWERATTWFVFAGFAALIVTDLIKAV